MTLKRCIRVCDPEEENGSVEYKRQVGDNPTRLRSLGTQMVFRMDQGTGQCVYQVGVEDDGCHSLLDYPAIAESCRILEYLARRLNAIVVQRTMIQDEIVLVQDENENEDDQYELAPNSSKPFVFEEPSILGNALGELQDWPGGRGQTPPAELQERRRPGILTRAEIRIQRIETHTLDQPPLSSSSSATATGSNNAKIRATTTNSSSSPRRRAGGEASTTQPRSSTETSKNGTTNKRRAGSSSPAQTNQRVMAPSSSSALFKAPQPVITKKTTSSNPTDTNIGETLSNRNVRVAVMGNVDAGKSTLIGTLTTSCLDDGRGKTRTSVMKHRHEIETGRTSTISSHLMGFQSDGKPISGRDSVRSNKVKGEAEIAKESYRVVTLMDLAGHEKFLKTTIHGVISGFADYALVLVNSRHPPTHMTTHHLNLCSSFNIPIIVVFTKIDGCPKHALETSEEQVLKLLSSPEVSKKPYRVESTDDISHVVDQLAGVGTNTKCPIAPMIHISCVTGDGIDLLQKLFFSLPKRRRHAAKTKRRFEFLVEATFNVPNVGAVVSGFVNAGELSVGANSVVYIGPMADGSFVKTVAKSAHIARINTTHISSGQSASLALASLDKDVRSHLRRGMVVLQEGPLASTMQFEAEVCVLKGQKTYAIREPHQTHVHVLNVRQTAIAREIELVQHGGSNNSSSPNGAKTKGDSMPQADMAFAASILNGDKDDDEDAKKANDEQSNHENHGNGYDNGDVEDEEEPVLLQPGSRAKVRFEFMQRPEYVRPGMRMLFRDGRVRGVGLVTAVPVLKTEAAA